MLNTCSPRDTNGVIKIVKAALYDRAAYAKTQSYPREPEASGNTYARYGIKLRNWRRASLEFYSFSFSEAEGNGDKFRGCTFTRARYTPALLSNFAPSIPPFDANYAGDRPKRELPNRRNWRFNEKLFLLRRINIECEEDTVAFMRKGNQRADH